MSSAEADARPPENVDSVKTATDLESNDVARPRRCSLEERLACKMFTYSREIISLFVAITLTLAAIHSAPAPRISKPPSAQPFFNQSSVIVDFYKGHLNAMVQSTSDADLSFIMYYAPWDAESQILRYEFESVAQYYYTKIFFAAINCWHPGSECRAQYSKIQSYPVLILSTPRDTPIEYTGIKTAPYMIRFLDAFIRPINRIRNKEQLAQLLAKSDAVVLGFIDFKGLSVSPGYKEFYRAATRLLGRDPNRDVTFAIVTDRQTAEKEFDVLSFPSMILSMWNETLVYPKGKPWTSQNLINWIGTSMHKVTLWLQPPGVKSLTLAPYLRDGPVLFLFTPRNPFHQPNYNYNLLREVALQYYSCEETWLTENLVNRLGEDTGNAPIKHWEQTKFCMEILNEIKFTPPTVSVSLEQWINETCCAKVLLNKCRLCKEKSASSTESGVCRASSENIQEICKGSDVFTAEENFDDLERQQQSCCDGKSGSNVRDRSSNMFSERDDSSMLDKNDPRSATNIEKSFIKDECTKLLAGNKYHKPVFPDVTKKNNESRVTESACRMNKTLAFIAIDSINYFHFAEGLGIDVLKKKDKTAVVILDAEQESQYLMNRELSREFLIDFINRYTDGLLQRSLRSESSRRFAHDFKSSRGCEDTKKTEVCVQELTTETFSKVVMDPTMDVVVMYHSPYCAFCSAVAYVYLTVARYLAKMDHLIFVRIDGDNNDLPWEYSMDRYPSILFFPAKRKGDSTVYPYSLPITIPNLLNFVLANMEGDSHVEALVNICASGSGESPQDCVARTRRLCLDIIEKLLKSYRKLRRSRDVMSKKTASKVGREILIKLEHMKEIHLILGSVDDLGEDAEKLRQIRTRFKTYYRNLKALIKRDERKILVDKDEQRIDNRIYRDEL